MESINRLLLPHPARLLGDMFNPANNGYPAQTCHSMISRTPEIPEVLTPKYSAIIGQVLPWLANSRNSF